MEKLNLLIKLVCYGEFFRTLYYRCSLYGVYFLSSICGRKETQDPRTSTNIYHSSTREDGGLYCLSIFFNSMPI